MPSLQGSLEHFQPLVHVSIAAYDRLDYRKQYRGLIDTGATRTCLTLRVITELALPPRGKMIVASARTAPERRRAYGFSLGLLCDVKDSFGAAQTLYVFDQEFTAPDFEDNDNFDVLIGMDLLCMGKFVLDRRHFTFDF